MRRNPYELPDRRDPYTREEWGTMPSPSLLVLCEVCAEASVPERTVMANSSWTCLDCYRRLKYSHPSETESYGPEDRASEWIAAHLHPDRKESP